MYCIVHSIVCYTITVVLAVDSVSVLPIARSPSVVERNMYDGSKCPCNTDIDQETNTNRNYLKRYLPFRPCECGSSSWTQIALYNYSIHDCLSDTTPYNVTDRNTERNITGCIGSPASVLLPVRGRNYSKVCGRIFGFGFGRAFYRFLKYRDSTINYLNGVSLTHGLHDNIRHIWHIWSFALTWSKESLNDLSWICPCTKKNSTWSHQIPSFVGNDYFCDSFSQYWDNFLWDGEMCVSTSPAAHSIILLTFVNI